MREIQVEVNGLTFTCFEEGNGPLALLLHGFPDSAHTWRYLFPRLAAAGFRAVAPFTRGYAPTEIPEDGCYQLGALVSDATGLHEALGGDSSAVLIGHDWGALTAYGAAAFAPARWRRVVTLGVAPLPVSMQAFFSYEQMKRSFYVFLFQTALAEPAVAMDDLAFIDGLWRDWSPRLDGSVFAGHAKDALRAPPNLGAAIGYYRAAYDAATHQERYAAAHAAAMEIAPQPLLYLQGTPDGAFIAVAEPAVLAALSPASRYEMMQGLGHFLHLEDPERVNARIIEWVTA